MFDERIFTKTQKWVLSTGIKVIQNNNNAMLFTIVMGNLDTFLG
jgi:hypothetical protein